MKKRTRFLFLTTTLVFVSVIISYFLLPSNEQMALNNYKDKNYAEALAIYEKQLADDNLSVDTVSTLTKVYLQYAKIDEAISVMEKFVAQNPSNLEARQELGSLYQYGQRTDDYVRNLEVMNELAKTSETMQKLMETYNLQNKEDKNIPLMIKKIIEENQGSPEEHRNLANILAAAKKYPQSLAVLELMQQKFAQQMLFGDYELMLRMYIELSKGKQAEAFAVTLVDKNFSDDEFARIANILLFLVSPQAAYNYVQALPEKVRGGDKVFEQNITILQAVSKKEKAYQMALMRYQEGKLSQDLLDDLMLLASNVGNKELFAELKGKINYDNLSASDVLSLIDVASGAGDEELIAKLKKRGDDIVAQTNDEYLAVILALMEGENQDSEQVIAVMNDQQLINRKLAIAQLCAKYKMNACVQSFFEQLPPYKDMSNEELAAAIGVLQQNGDYKQAYELANEAIATHEGGGFQNIWFPLAAIFAEAEIIKPYLVEGSPLESKAYIDGYYLAMDNKSYSNAVAIAEFLYSENDNDANRNFVAQAYLMSGNYEQALPLIRKTKDKVANGEQDYLFVLTKLAKNNPTYGAELRKYGIEVLESGTNGKRKQAMIGALIAGGQQTAIMPYIKSMAIANPREWSYLYANYLQKTSGQGAVTQFWQQVAERHAGDVELRRQIAYNLLENGEKDVAIQMFMALCDDSNARANDSLTKELLYLWSPIYPEEALQWLNQKAVNATDATEKRAWLINMANGTNDAGLLELAERQPALLKVNVVENRYIDVLAKSDDAKAEAYFKKAISATNDVAQLLNYANLAQGYGFQNQAHAAYDAALKQAPNNPLVLAKAGVFAAGEANYEVSKQLLGNYFKAEIPSLPNTAEAYRPHFYYGEDLRREGKTQEAKKYYKQVINAAQMSPAKDYELQSMAATSLARIGKEKQAIAEFQRLIAEKPNDRQLRADYSALLVDVKQYELAEKSLPAWREVEQKDKQSEKQEQQFAIQNELIKSRIEVENGRGYDAAMRTRALSDKYPEDAQVLGFAANVENFNGNWPYARRLINKAHELKPYNDDITALQRGIERLHASNVYLDGSWRSLGKNNEYIGTLGGSYDVNENVQVGVELQNDWVRSTDLRLSNGVQGKFNDERQRGEAFLRYFDEKGDTSQLSIFANNDTAGLGAYHRFVNPLGLSNFGLEFQRPDWQFVQGVIDDATRNRAFVGHRYSPTNPVIIEGQVGLNQYNTKNGDNLSSTATIQGSVSYRIKEAPYVAVSYNLDAEYELSEKNSRLSNGQPYQLFPLDSREVHSIGVLASHNFSKDTNAEGFASYGYERIDGNSGPAVEGRVTHYLDDRWAVQGHAGYGFRGGANDGSLTQGGIRLMYRY
jgi:tetratricopeptide (TPR) repeat protein